MRYIIFTISILLAVACKRDNYKNNNLSLDLEDMKISSKSGELLIVDSLQIEVDSITSPIQYYDQIYKENGENYYVIFNKANNAIQLYDLSDGHFSKIHFDKEGPNYIPENSLFFIHDRDSIFFINHETAKIYLANSYGNVYKIFSLKYYDKGTVSTNEMFLKLEYNPTRKAVYFWLYPNPPAYSWTSKFYHLAKIGEQQLNPDTAIYFGEYPPEFKDSDNLYYPNEYFNGYVNGNNYVVYYYPSHEIQIYDLESKNIIRRIKSKSSYVQDKIPYYMKDGEETPDINEEFKYLTENSFNVKMMSSTDGKIHYKIVKHGVPFFYNDGKKRHYQDIPFSVMVLDKNFDLITEKKFEGGLFDFFQSFVVDHKLYLSYNNMLNENRDENSFKFVVFELR